MRLSEKGRKFIQDKESYSDVPYLCPAGYWTVGWGHVIPEKLFKNYAARPITQQEADTLFSQDTWDAESAVNAMKVPLEQHQYDALVSLVFNIGVGAFANSTLRKMLVNRQYVAAADQFLRWNKAGGKVLRGLVSRRKAERRIFLGDAGAY